MFGSMGSTVLTGNTLDEVVKVLAVLNSSRAAIIRDCKVFATSPPLRAASSDRTFELD